MTKEEWRKRYTAFKAALNYVAMVAMVVAIPVAIGIGANRLTPVIDGKILPIIVGASTIGLIIFFLAYREFLKNPYGPPPLHDRIRDARDELGSVLEQLGQVMNRTQSLLSVLDKDLNERDTKIAERRAELERLKKAAEVKPEAIELIEEMLEERDVKTTRRDRARDLRFLIAGALIGALLGIPGSWIAAWLPPDIVPPHSPPPATSTPSGR